MVGNKIIAAIRSDGKVYPLDDGDGGSVTGGSVLNSNHSHFANLVNMKLRVGPGNGQQNMNDTSEIIMTNNRIQAPIMDLGKKLLQCARDNDVNGVESMMKKGAPFASDWLGMTALHFAAMNDRYDICKLLLISGGNKDARTKVDRTPLHLAAFYGHERIAQLLIEYQCSLNPRDMLRMTPLHWAVEKRHKGIVRLLLKHQADVTAISKFGKTPIALAVLTEQADILQELETARQIQQNKKYNEQHEKETNEAVNSIMGTIKDEDEPQAKKAKISVETENPTKSNFDIPIDNLEDINVPDEKSFDNSTINLLKSHGISMMKDDEDTPDNLLTTVLQNGRQLILSEGGKLLLNEARRLGGNKVIETMKSSPSSHSSSTVTQVRTRTESEASQTQSVPKFRPNIISKPKEVTRVVAASDITANNNGDKQFKNIRIISLNDFKKLYGTGNVKPLQKFESSLNKTQVIKFKSEEKKVFPQRKIVEEGFKMETISHNEDSEYHDDDDEENDLPPNIVKVSAESDQEDDSSDIESPQSNQTSVIHPPVQQPVIEPRLLPGRKLSNSNNSRVSYSRAPSVASTIDFKQERTPVIPLLTIPEICRQLLELRKQNDELRRKYEIAQKEKEDFRNRLERLEALLLLEQAEEGYSEM